MSIGVPELAGERRALPRIGNAPTMTSRWLYDEAAANIALAVVVACTSLSLITPPGRVLAATLIIGCGAAFVVAHHSKGGLPRIFWAALLAMGIIAVRYPPAISLDLWSYAFSGRVWSVYHQNPYVVAPFRHPHDPAGMQAGWDHTAAVYGPIFTAIEAVFALVARNSMVVLRLCFQVLAAGSVLWCLRAAARRGNYAVVALVGAQPFVWTVVVNGGHIDAVAAAFTVAAAIAFTGVTTTDGRLAKAVALLSIACLIKVTAVFIVGPLAFGLLLRRRFVPAIITGAVPVGLLLLGEVVIPGSLSNAFDATGGAVSRASLWRLVEELFTLDKSTVATAGMALLLTTLAALTLVIGWRRRSGPIMSGAVLSSYPMVAAYTLPWYVITGAGLLAVEGDLAVAAPVVVRGATMSAAYAHTPGVGAPGLVTTVLEIWVPSVILVWFLWAALKRRSTAGPDEDPESAVG